ncbi:uncharacterized protein [Linepithema humile]|uniref:uncharacterized protein n=1 Tax=Linepithema humile TaxID=83485 RepID=UPI00351ECD6E
MVITLLQANVNHAGGAQDLLIQYMTEVRTSLAIVTELYRILDNPRWWGSTANWVAVEWGTYLVIGCYCSPRMDRTNFREFLNSVSTLLDPNMSRPILFLGDFNARSFQWDKKCSVKGRLLADWAAGRGLILVNRDDTPTFTLVTDCDNTGDGNCGSLPQLMYFPTQGGRTLSSVSSGQAPG